MLCGRSSPTLLGNNIPALATFGITQPIGLPQINVAGALNFGGPRQLPHGRGDTGFIVSDTLSRLSGAHSIKLGGEYGRFFSNFFMTDVGQFNFPNIGSFIVGNANSFSITLPSTSSSIAPTSTGPLHSRQPQVEVEPDARSGLSIRIEPRAYRAVQSIHRLQS
jgi:hypothetical protein